MSQPLAEADAAHASAIASARRRLRMVTDLGDMAITLAQAVHECALAQEAAAVRPHLR